MLLLTSAASLEDRQSLQNQNLRVDSTKLFTPLCNIKLCKYFDEKIVFKRMKENSSFVNDSNTYEPSKIKSSKNLHERQVRSLERSNKFTKSKFSFTGKTNYDDFIRNSSDQIMNNGESVSMEKNISESTLATYKDSDVKANVQKEASQLHVNGLKLVLTALGILIPIASIIYCLYTTRRSATSIEQVQRRLENDNNLLNQSLPDFEALMLSVQNLGCAGMERLGTVGAPVDIDNRSIRRFPIQHDLIISANRQTQNLLNESKTEPNNSGINSEAFQNYKRCNINTSCSPNSSCPPHIHRGNDGELRRDRFSNSSSHHNAEVKRCFIQAPPNKTVQDVPDFSYSDTQPFHNSIPYSHQRQQLVPNKVDNKGKMGDKFKGFFQPILKIIDNGSTSSSCKVGSAENSKLNSNIASMPRSQSSYVSTSNELVVLNGSTNFNLHSKSFVNDLKSSSSPETGAKLLKPSSSSSLSGGPSPEHNNCL